MIFVIGDIHGESEKLEDLIIKILRIDKNPELIFIGDYIDKGNKPLETLLFLKELNSSYKCRYIMGNHEYYWLNLNQSNLNAENYLTKFGGLKTTDSFNLNFEQVNKVLTNEFGFIFKHLENFIIQDNFLICHCGYQPTNNKIQQLSSKDWISLNRYQFLNSNLTSFPYSIIFGHTAFYYPYINNNKIGIDTGACYLNKQPLTSFCIDEKFFVDSNSETLIKLESQLDKCPIIIRTKIL